MCEEECDKFLTYARRYSPDIVRMKGDWMINYKECKGCVTLSSEGRCIGGFIPRISETEYCPCLNCILKGMCSFACEKFGAYSKKCIRLRDMKDALKYATSM